MPPIFNKKRRLSTTEASAVKKVLQTMSSPVPRSRFSIPKTLELKEFEDMIYSSAAITPGGTVSSIVNIPQGVDIKNRIGRHVNYVGVDITVIIAPQALTTFIEDFVYFALIHDKQPNGTSALYTDIFQSATITNPALQYRNTSQFRDRFKILWEQRSWISQGLAAGTGYGMQGDKLYYRKHFNLKKLGKLAIAEYNTSATATPNVNGLYLVASTFSNVANNGPLLTACSKLIFTDP